MFEPSAASRTRVLARDVLTVLERAPDDNVGLLPAAKGETIILRIAILDDWQDVARGSADWSRLAARADLTFFPDAFATEDEAAVALADFDILLTMRERTAFPETLIRRLPKLRMISITGAANASLDVAACTRQGVTVCNTAGGGPGAPYATAELALGLLIAAARAIPIADKTMRAGGFQRGVPHRPGARRQNARRRRSRSSRRAHGALRHCA